METSRSVEAFAALRQDILTGALRPGQKIPFGELRERYQVSVGVAREALQRLVEQGLVTSAPGQGFRIMQISGEDLLDLTAARCEIECIALRLSITHADLQWESELVAAHHTLARTAVRSDSGEITPAWVSAHSRFHEAILLGCPNRRLIAIAMSLRDSAEVYRQWSMPTSHDDRLAEHAGLLDALLARDADDAVRLLGEHIWRTTTILLPDQAASESMRGEKGFVAG